MKNNTNIPKKIVFIISFIASAILSIVLFQSASKNIPLKLLFSAIALATVLFQTIKLREFFITKTSKRYIALFFYILCTIASMGATVGAGLSQLENIKPNISKNKLADKEKIINKILTETENVNQWSGLAYLKRLDKIETKKGIIKKMKNGIINSISGISKVIGVSEEKVSFYFLLFIAFIIDAMIFGSVDYNDNSGKGRGKKNKKPKKPKKPKITKLQKEKNAGQMMMKLRIA